MVFIGVNVNLSVEIAFSGVFRCINNRLYLSSVFITKSNFDRYNILLILILKNGPKPVLNSKSHEFVSW